MAQMGKMQAATARAIPSGANGKPGIFGQPRRQLIAEAKRTYMRAQIGGGSLSIIRAT